MKFFLLLVLILFFVPSVSAHPGRTDSSGGHTCRTNCESWGLSYGEYHTHGGGSTSTNVSPVQETAPTNTPVPQRVIPSYTLIPTKSPTPTITPTPTKKVEKKTVKKMKKKAKPTATAAKQWWNFF